MNYIKACRGFKTLALTAMLGFAVIGLSQCRMVDETVTGVELNTADGIHGRSNCIDKCNDKYKDASHREDQRHAAAVRACGGRRACVNTENALHDKNEKKINDDKNNCKRNCYNEGSGGGGR